MKSRGFEQSPFRAALRGGGRRTSAARPITPASTISSRLRLSQRRSACRRTRENTRADHAAATEWTVERFARPKYALAGQPRSGATRDRELKGRRRARVISNGSVVLRLRDFRPWEEEMRQIELFAEPHHPGLPLERGALAPPRHARVKIDAQRARQGDEARTRLVSLTPIDHIITRFNSQPINARRLSDRTAGFWCLGRLKEWIRGCALLP